MAIGGVRRAGVVGGVGARALLVRPGSGVGTASVPRPAVALARGLGQRIAGLWANVTGRGNVVAAAPEHGIQSMGGLAAFGALPLGYFDGYAEDVASVPYGWAGPAAVALVLGGLAIWGFITNRNEARRTQLAPIPREERIATSASARSDHVSGE
ncbi:MAG: hypothetical protein HY696_02560 [Deltaproteobacteria bacterium]|nr:hypothetical protein [Deltaproteobacteria bacterium]